MSRAVRWERLTRDELAASAGGSVLVLPVAATEQHGPHLATGTDALLCTAVADRAAQASGVSTVVAPTVALGVSEHHLPFGATLSISAETLDGILRDTIASAVSAGFRRILVLNGHGGNTSVCRVAADRAAATHGIEVEARCYWDDVALDGSPFVPGHAGRFETALTLALEPANVRPELARPSPGSPPWGAGDGSAERWREIDGFTDEPQHATAEEGAAWLDACVVAVAETIRRLVLDAG